MLWEISLGGGRRGFKVKKGKGKKNIKLLFEVWKKELKMGGRGRKVKKGLIMLTTR